MGSGLQFGARWSSSHRGTQPSLSWGHSSGALPASSLLQPLAFMSAQDQEETLAGNSPSPQS